MLTIRRPESNQIKSTTQMKNKSRIRVDYENSDFFGIRYPYSQSEALKFYDYVRPILRKVYLTLKKRFLKGALKGVLGRRVSYQKPLTIPTLSS